MQLQWLQLAIMKMVGLELKWELKKDCVSPPQHATQCGGGNRSDAQPPTAGCAIATSGPPKPSPPLPSKSHSSSAAAASAGASCRLRRTRSRGQAAAASVAAAAGRAA